MVAAATERATCDGQFENLTAKIDSLQNFVDNINITILLNQYIRYFFVRLLFQVATCNMLIISALRCIDFISCVGGRCFAPPLCSVFANIVSVCCVRD